MAIQHDWECRWNVLSKENGGAAFTQRRNEDGYQATHIDDYTVRSTMAMT